MIPSLDLPKRREPWKVWLFSDVHIGARTFDNAKWARHIQRAQEEGWRAICLGDLFEMVTLDSKVAASAIWEQDKLPPVQILEGIRWLEMIPHFDGAIEGNHDGRFAKTAGASAWDLIVLPQIRSKRSPAKYLGAGGLFNYHLANGKRISLCLTHGEGGGTANPRMTSQRMSLAWPGAQVYASGHTHSLVVENLQVETPDGERDVKWIKTGTYLRFPEYAKRRLYAGPRNTTGSILLTLHADATVEAELLT